VVLLGQPRQSLQQGDDIEVPPLSDPTTGSRVSPGARERVKWKGVDDAFKKVTAPAGVAVVRNSTGFLQP
jgi:hypothetical protein